MEKPPAPVSLPRKAMHELVGRGVGSRLWWGGVSAYVAPRVLRRQGGMRRNGDYGLGV